MIGIYRESNHNKRVSSLRPAFCRKILSQAQAQIAYEIYSY